MKLKFTHFPVIKNTIKQVAFRNAYKESKVYQSFLYASIPAESTSYAPSFFRSDEKVLITWWNLLNNHEIYWITIDLGVMNKSL